LLIHQQDAAGLILFDDNTRRGAAVVESTHIGPSFIFWKGGWKSK
jgi:hypothetical protein